ncbi:MAG: PTS sugar transporter subunit IIA [Acidobacteriota bacterium]
MRLEALTDPQLVFADLPCFDRSSLLRSFAERIVEAGRLDDTEALYSKLWEREQLGSTAIGDGVAVPHCKVADLSQVIVAIGLLRNGIEFGAVDHQPVRLFFVVVSPEDQPAAHLQCLAAISKWIKAERHIERIMKLEDSASILDLIREDS